MSTEMAPLVLPKRRGAVPDETVRFAIAVLLSSGVPARLEAVLKRRCGRRRQLSVLALFVALFVLALDDRPLHLSEVTDLLYRRLSDELRAELDISLVANDRRAFLARYRCVRYLFHQILAALHPLEASADERRLVLESRVNELIEATLALRSAEEVAAFDGTCGLDATPVPLYSRGPSKRSGRPAFDPDGGWYVREGDHRGEEDHRGRVANKVFWALEATILTMAPPVGDPAAHANLVLGAILAPPGVDPGGSAKRLCASVVARGHRPGILGADRAYSCAKADVFHLPLRALGYRLVFDYRGDELGVQANSGGALLVEGAWCCPAMPNALVSASSDRRAGRIDEQTYTARLAARADYRLVHKAGPDADGYERFACPAQGPRPRLCCPLRPASHAALGALPVLEAPALAPPRVCCQGSITIAPDVGARHRQHLQFASEEWHRRYATCRNTIEGLNGFAKDAAHECLAAPQRRRVRGLPAQSLFVAFLLMAANVRKLRAHRELVAEGRRAAVAKRARRRRVRLQDFATA